MTEHNGENPPDDPTGEPDEPAAGPTAEATNEDARVNGETDHDQTTGDPADAGAAAAVAPAPESESVPSPLVTESQLLVDLEGFEGPIDVLLTLARDQKVDLSKISILQLADQYLAFVARVRSVRLELAADYLVMAAWLAYLKSRLLLPEPENMDEQPTGQEMAAALAFQLLRLESMQEAGVRLMARSLLGRDVFARGAPEPIEVITHATYETKLYDLLTAYGAIRAKAEGHRALEIAPMGLYSVEMALERLREQLGHMPDWLSLVSFLPTGLKGSLVMRSALASTFVATLELVREGKLMLRQSGPYAQIFVRTAPERPQE